MARTTKALTPTEIKNAKPKKNGDKLTDNKLQDGKHCNYGATIANNAECY